jgi:hypothetical protein
MRQLPIALTLPILLLLVGTTGHAKEVKGTPAVMIGTFGRDAEQCRAWHRNSDVITNFDKDSYSDCGGTKCAALVSHTVTRTGFILKLQFFGWENKPYYITHKVTKIDKDTFDLRGPGKDHSKLVRCKEKDIIAGIGFDSLNSLPEDNGYRTLFSVYYALAVPAVCNETEAQIKSGRFLEADEMLAERAIAEGRRELLEKWRRWPPDLSRNLLQDPEQSLWRSLTSRSADAALALEVDMNAIKNFCGEVLNAYGPNGTTIPNLLRLVDHAPDTERKSRALYPVYSKESAWPDVQNFVVPEIKR